MGILLERIRTGLEPLAPGTQQPASASIMMTINGARFPRRSPGQICHHIYSSVPSRNGGSIYRHPKSAAECGNMASISPNLDGSFWEMTARRRAGHRFSCPVQLAITGVVLMSSCFLAGGTALAATSHTVYTAAPDTTHSKCTTGSSSGNVDTCMYIVYSGAELEYADASANVITSARDLLICMSYPSGIVFACSNDGYYEWRNPGQAAVAGPYVWDATGEPTGNYCARTYRMNSNGTIATIGTACVNYPG
jgi:hypothetical protein